MSKTSKLLSILALSALVAACGDDVKSSSGTGGSNNSSADAGTTPVIDAGFPGQNEDAGTEMDAGTSGGTVSDEWYKVCSADTECGNPTDFCVKQPGQSEGYCSVRCSKTTECTELNPPADWTCNAVFAACDGSDFTWCGPSSEIGMGPISECE